MTFDDLSKKVNSRIQRSLALSREKGISNWLAILSIAEHGFALHKGDFRDSLSLWRFPYKAAQRTEGFDSKPTIDEICDGVGVEPPLQPLTQECLHLKTAHRQDGARLDVVPEGFWGFR